MFQQACEVIPQWACMWGLAGTLYAAGKLTTWRLCSVPAGVARQLAYLTVWPGMNAGAFFTRSPVEGPTHGEWLRGLVGLLSGGLLLSVHPQLLKWSALLAGAAGMMAIVLTLHFGVFQLLSCFWRARGVRARPLMNQPLRSCSLSEFWGQRWNTAFRDLTHDLLFRPLAKRFGPKASLLMGFFVSGLVHDLVISLPARGGYGGPTLYFVIQGLALLIERSHLGQTCGLGRGRVGWLFCGLIVIGPVALLFHAPFLTHVMNPFLQGELR